MKALIFLAPGFEESEAIVPIDLLLRAGIEVVTCSLSENREVKGSHGIIVMADKLIDEIEDSGWDAIIAPGGMPGAVNISQSWRANEIIIKGANEENTLISAICAAPAVVLGPLGLLTGHYATCYPGFEEYRPDFNFSKEGVCIDGRLVTAKAAGYAFDFALRIIRILLGEKKASEVASKIYWEER